jgi:hypothetical protein
MREPETSRSIYCKECKLEKSRENNRRIAKRKSEERARQRAKMGDKICPNCKKSFKRKTPKQIYCTFECRLEMKRKEDKEKRKGQNNDSIIGKDGKIDPYFLRRGKIHYGMKDVG